MSKRRSVSAGNYNGNRSRSNQYYQFSSEAHELAPLVQPNPRIRKVKKGVRLTKRQRSNMIKERNRPTYYYEEKPERKVSLATIVFSVVIFVSAFAYLLSYSFISIGNKDITVLESQLATIKNDNAIIENEMYNDYDLGYVEEVATKKLGMSKPENHQIVYIETPKNNYFVKSSEQKPVEQANISNLFGLLIND